MTTYYEIKAINIDGDTEVLFGSFSKSDCSYELQAERDSWKDEGYRSFKIAGRDTDEQPDAEVYADNDDVDLDPDVDANLTNFDTIQELVVYLNNTLIPDLKEAGSYATAEDFEDCVEAIRALRANQRPQPVDSEQVLRTVILRGRPEVC